MNYQFNILQDEAKKRKAMGSKIELIDVSDRKLEIGESVKEWRLSKAGQTLASSVEMKEYAPTKMETDPKKAWSIQQSSLPEEQRVAWDQLNKDSQKGFSEQWELQVDQNNKQQEMVKSTNQSEGYQAGAQNAANIAQGVDGMTTTTTTKEAESTGPTAAQGIGAGVAAGQMGLDLYAQSKGGAGDKTNTAKSTLAGAGTGATIGALGGPVGAGIGAGVGAAVGLASGVMAAKAKRKAAEAAAKKEHLIRQATIEREKADRLQKAYSSMSNTITNIFGSI